jgi:hypothetical protein
MINFLFAGWALTGNEIGEKNVLPFKTAGHFFALTTLELNSGLKFKPLPVPHQEAADCFYFLLVCNSHHCTASMRYNVKPLHSS